MFPFPWLISGGSLACTAWWSGSEGLDEADAWGTCEWSRGLDSGRGGWKCLVDYCCREHLSLGCCVLAVLPAGVVDSSRL